MEEDIKEKLEEQRVLDREFNKQLYKAFETDDKYEYVRSIACGHLLDYDENGEPCGWGVSLDLFRGLHTDVGEDYPIPREKYDKNKTIQDSIAAIGLDSEKLWHAIRFIRFMSKSKHEKAIPLLPPLGPQVEQLIESLKVKEAKIRAEFPEKKTVVLSNEIRKYLADLVERDYGSRKDDLFFTGNTVKFGEEISIGILRQMAYEANLYMEIFKEYSTDKDLPRRGKQGPSRDKLLLASRLLFLTGLTDKLQFWQGKDPLKGVMRKCQNVSHKDTYISRYVF